MLRSATHQLIRERSQVLHDALDQNRVMKQLLAPTISLNDYRSVMIRMHDCLSCIEPALIAFEHSCVDFTEIARMNAYSPRLPLLALDLENLGVSRADDVASSSIELSSIEIAGIKVRSFGAYLGARYVLEGASLGSVFIAHQLHKHCPAITAQASQYWKFQSARVSCWPEFLTTLATLDNNASEQQASIDTALLTFQVYLNFFDEDAHGE